MLPFNVVASQTLLEPSYGTLSVVILRRSDHCSRKTVPASSIQAKANLKPSQSYCVVSGSSFGIWRREKMFITASWLG
jgi:hypothetical protein